MASPAERYAAARARQGEAASPLAEFRRTLPFELDDFQVEACRAVADGHGVLVAAPTGAGKTVVGEFAVFHALAGGRKAFYTTPIKALSNQKYADLVQRHGADRVGLLTGDTSVNGEAPVVVMTTEVLRNMIYAGSPTLRGLGWVVMDEVHYLADRFRGAVWEEVILHLPQDVTLVSLSATVSNAEEFGEWLGTVRGNTRVIVSEERPVPLWQHVLTGNRLLDLFVDDDGEPVHPAAADIRARVNPEVAALARIRSRAGRPGRGRGGRDQGRRGGPARSAGPGRPQTIELLAGQGLLPGIVFVFSRAGCDAAVAQCTAAGLRLTSAAERSRIREIVAAHVEAIPPGDLAVLGFESWRAALERGLAAHHAGLLPAFKEAVEALFQQGLVKVVFATETLALGVNMPARSVVLERLVKWNGETHAELTPGEYTQLTGRAGRRGIDVEGHAVVVWTDESDPDHVAGLASARTYPLRSSFRPTYSMAVNLVDRVGRGAAREILETSFAQFQADRAVVGLARRARQQAEALDGYSEAMSCHLGDIEEYMALRGEVAQAERVLERRRAGRDRETALRRGDVVAAGPRTWVVVLESGSQRAGRGPMVLTEDRHVRRLGWEDVDVTRGPLASVRVPRDFRPTDAQARRDLATDAASAVRAGGEIPAGVPRGRRLSAPDAERHVSSLTRRLKSHPCHGCAELPAHLRWAERRERVAAEHAGTQRRIEGRTASIARAFDRVLDVLGDLGYADGDTVTDHGRMLQRIYSQSDLVVAECLREGIWRGLDGPGLAAVVSTLVFESRRDGLLAPAPGGRVGNAIEATSRVWARVAQVEQAHRTPPSPEPDPGFSRVVLGWARGRSLGEALEGHELTPGDFVRSCRQTVDLLDQVAALSAADAEVAAAAADALDRVRRGVVRSTVG